MNPKSTPLYSIFLKLGLVFLIASIIMLFIVEYNSAEFYIMILTAVLMSIFVAIGTWNLRKKDKNDKKI